MKQLAIICLLLISSGALAQSHTFRGNEEKSIDNNGDWGEWVISSYDIEIRNAGSGVYLVRIYKYLSTDSKFILKCKYDRMENGKYVYIQTGTNQVPFRKIEANKKLSHMAIGVDGPLNIWFSNGDVVAYNCIDL